MIFQGMKVQNYFILLSRIYDGSLRFLERGVLWLHNFEKKI